MTITEFNNLKVGDFVWLRGRMTKDKYLRVEVLQKDNFFKKLNVFFGKRKFYSYKYLQIKVPVDKQDRVMVGLWKVEEPKINKKKKSVFYPY